MAAARRNYRAYTHAYVLDDDGPLLEAMQASRYAIGGPEFIERTERQLEGRRSGRAQDADLALPRRRSPSSGSTGWLRRNTASSRPT